MLRPNTTAGLFLPDTRNIGGRHMIIDTHAAHRKHLRPASPAVPPPRAAKSVVDTSAPKTYHLKHSLSASRRKRAFAEQMAHERTLDHMDRRIIDNAKHSHFDVPQLDSTASRPSTRSGRPVSAPRTVARRPTSAYSGTARTSTLTAGIYRPSTQQSSRTASSRLQQERDLTAFTNRYANSTGPSNSRLAQQRRLEEELQIPYPAYDGVDNMDPALEMAPYDDFDDYEDHQFSGAATRYPPMRSEPDPVLELYDEYAYTYSKSRPAMNTTDPYVALKQYLVKTIVEEKMYAKKELEYFFDQTLKLCKLPDQGRLRRMINDLKREFFIDK
eukprot:gnl/Hemi2/21502_TR7159_c0_g1_i1.p1 gnl/Hemi2/21502_TR7159_c0_g1~~gnl/Hemi2/21502_TR7159_c0_g1_i1.p1  ORF type:complete len:329 (+),score=78.78 gnl/Hemi2/21502_TR7159_c0_g1_i1:216-1202(+)